MSWSKFCKACLIVVAATAAGLIDGNTPRECAGAANDRDAGALQRAQKESDESAELARGAILQGWIVDENDKPLQGVKVTLWSGVATRWRGQETVTDGSGEYFFDPVKSGAALLGRKLMVGVTLTHHTHASSDGKAWWDVTMSSENRKVEVKNFKMTRGADIAGFVVRKDTGEPIADLDLRILLGQGKQSGGIRYATTDQQGRFSETALFPGQYEVQVNGGGFKVLGTVKLEPGRCTETRLLLEANDPPREIRGQSGPYSQN